jgi:hypothetical protein
MECLGKQKKVIDALECEKEAAVNELKEWKKKAMMQGFQDVDCFMAGEFDTLNQTIKSLETSKLNGNGPGSRSYIQNGVCCLLG